MRAREPAVWLDTAGAASVLGVHPRTVMKFVVAGRLAASRVGKLWRFRREDVEQLLAGRGGSPATNVDVDDARELCGVTDGPGAEREACVDGRAAHARSGGGLGELCAADVEGHLGRRGAGEGGA
jgi:excisionase family DNA binding protein